MTKHLSEDGITFRHTLAYYTFLPIVAIAFVTPGASLLLFIFNEIGIITAILGVNTPLLLCSLYVATLGDYIVPKETYRKYRSGELTQE